LRRQPVARPTDRHALAELEYAPRPILARVEQLVIRRQLLALAEGVAEEYGLLERHRLDGEGGSVLALHLAEGAGVVAHHLLVLALGDLVATQEERPGQTDAGRRLLVRVGGALGADDELPGGDNC